MNYIYVELQGQEGIMFYKKNCPYRVTGTGRGHVCTVNNRVTGQEGVMFYTMNRLPVQWGGIHTPQVVSGVVVPVSAFKSKIRVK